MNAHSDSRAAPALQRPTVADASPTVDWSEPKMASDDLKLDHEPSADDYDRRAEQKKVAALRLANAAAEYADADERVFASVLRAAAKYASGARGDRARARELRS